MPPTAAPATANADAADFILAFESFANLCRSRSARVNDCRNGAVLPVTGMEIDLLAIVLDSSPR